MRSPLANRVLDLFVVNRDRAGVLYIDGKYVETLEPGEYAFWKGAGEVRVQEVDRREQMVDVGGQDIMTSDKVTLRLNAVVTYRSSIHASHSARLKMCDKHSIVILSLCCVA